jgi:hypothetical protein
MYQDPKAIERWDIILGGTLAFSGLRTCTTMKIEMSTAKTTSRAIIRLLLHGYVNPPHCRASSRHIIPGRKIIVPTGSSCMMRALKAIGACSFSGVLRKKRIPPKVMLPIGKF